MHLVQLVVATGVFLVPAAWAGSQAKPPPGHPAAVAPVSAASTQLVHRQAEVERLAQDVGKQESDSRQASERLQRQDRTIAELRKQLQALQADPAAGQP